MTDTTDWVRQIASVLYEPLHPPQSRQEIGRRLKATRDALGMSVAEICDMLGITKQAWSQYEHGNRRPDLNPMLILADRKGVSLDWIYRGVTSHLPMDLGLKILQHLATPPA
ncbi:helix-turn-helix transcriptional regulator [Azospirillum sp. YIM DDC1]|uniref:Helix-turn-helix transcriptional regulator n=1 Tax=Azospirillum aestuarii TaxID=2802052 RepID=A0ABS1I6M2_9PROT|nr:helix-turn-helix transcriptional regulator [Azospirillum aestuarii]MBK4722720.1 helix-turn-helix transcriptional regulator [Azospirillum aestuarii]